jgi:hypothetical protein
MPRASLGVLKLENRGYHVDANPALTQRQLAIVVLGARSRRLLQPVLTEGHFDVATAELGTEFRYVL